MKQEFFIVESNIPLTENVYRMTLSGDTSAINAPGQFVNIKLDGKFLRRPISVCDCESKKLTLIYKTVGGGTEQMSKIKPGERLDLLTGLGNGYDTSLSGDRPLLIGGGVGIPPLFMLAKKLVAEGKHPTCIFGYNKKSEVFHEKAFCVPGVSVCTVTADGSYGAKGLVTDAMTEFDYTYFYTCGPEPMLKAIYRISNTSGQFSFEERMGCGFGACMGCSCKTVTGYKRICREGPVLNKEEILWNK